MARWVFRRKDKEGEVECNLVFQATNTDHALTIVNSIVTNENTWLGSININKIEEIPPEVK